MNPLQQKSSSLFERFTKQLGKVDLSMAAAMPAMAGVITVLSGAVLEAHGQLSVLQHSGIAALDAYKASIALDLPISDWLHLGLGGKLPSFGGNAEARGFVAMFVAPTLGVAAVSLARQFDSLKTVLSGKLQSIHGWMHTSEPEYLEPFLKQGQISIDAGGLPDQARPPLQLGSRIGTMEMVHRVALAHDIDVSKLVLYGDEIRHVDLPLGDRPICKMGSPYWTELEQETFELHRFAHKHQLDAATLYIREGAVYEANRHAFVDREVCDLSSPEWNDLRLEIIAEVNMYASNSRHVQAEPIAALPTRDEIACLLLAIDEDFTVERIDEVLAQISTLRATQVAPIGLDREVDAALRALDSEAAATIVRESAPQSLPLQLNDQNKPSFEM